MRELQKKELPETVSRFAYDETVARMDIHNNRLFKIVIVLAIVAILEFCGLLACFIYETQFEDSVITHTQEVEQSADGDGNNTFVGGDNYGYEAESQNNHYDQNTEA